MSYNTHPHVASSSRAYAKMFAIGSLAVVAVGVGLVIEAIRHFL